MNTKEDGPAAPAAAAAVTGKQQQLQTKTHEYMRRKTGTRSFGQSQTRRPAERQSAHYVKARLDQLGQGVLEHSESVTLGIV